MERPDSIAYIAGPMTGYPDYNYAAFNDCEAGLVANGYIVNNPARHFNGDTTLPRHMYLREALKALMKSDTVFVLPGWEHSAGANLEVDVALELGMPIFQWRQELGWGTQIFPSERAVREPALVLVPEPLPPRADVLDEAARLITGDRNNQYGPPTQDFRRTSDALTAMGYRRLDTDEVTPLALVPSDVALMVGMVKISRLMHQRNKRDNWTDLAGYAGCGYECSQEENA